MLPNGRGHASMSTLVLGSFGQWLKQRRHETGISQDDLATALACSESTLQKIESGERRPSRQIALLLAALLQIPADEHEAFVAFARAGSGPAPAQRPATGAHGAAPRAAPPARAPALAVNAPAP